jgi:[acyl-carrier-protein] S-malonyltransferase
MSIRLAILCPGQGAQHAGMFDLARTDADAARKIAGWNLPPMDDLFANRDAQPLIVAAACGTWAALRTRIPKPYRVAGYSVGEVSALAVAGVLDASQAIRLAAERARLMDACVDAAIPQGLLAVSGIVKPTLVLLLAQAGLQTALHIAIENGDDQFILGGLARDLSVLRPRLDAAGARVQLLPVAIASHTPWMQAAVSPLRTFMNSMHFGVPDAALLAGISGAVMTSGTDAASALALQTVQAVLWSACMDALAEAGVNAALELGPGSALSRMLAARHRHITCRSVTDFRSIAGIAGWVERLSD